MKEDGYDWISPFILIAVVCCVGAAFVCSAKFGFLPVVIFAGSIFSILWCVSVIVLLVKILNKLPKT